MDVPAKDKMMHENDSELSHNQSEAGKNQKREPGMDMDVHDEDMMDHTESPDLDDQMPESDAEADHEHSGSDDHG